MATVKEKMQDSITKIKEFYSGDKRKKRLGITAIVLTLIIAVSIFTAVMLNKKEYVTLFSEISTDDISSVVSKLDEYGVKDYKIQNDSIMVLSKEEDNIRAKLAQSGGYPKSGFGYETYSKQLGMLTSESARQTALVQDLQDRIGATIKCFNGVKDAKVNIQTGSDNRYVLDSENSVPASASVFVEMQGNNEMPEKYVEAIGNLISTSVSGLKFDNISITDSLGNSYTPGDKNSTDSSHSSSDLKLRLEEQVSERIKRDVLEAITPIYGYGNVKVSVNSTVDVSRKVQESVVYTTPEGANAGEGIIGRYEYDQSITRPSDQQAVGAAGAQANADIDTYMNTQNAIQGNESTINNSGKKDFNVNSVTEQSEQNFGVVTDVMIAVTINESAAGNIAGDQLVNHIARAAGIQPDQQAEKINVLIAPFYNAVIDTNDEQKTDGKGKLPNWAIYAIGGVIGLLLVLIILLIIIKKRRKKAKALAEQEAAKEEEERKALEAAMFNNAELTDAERRAAEAAAKRDILDIQNERSLELKQDIRKFTEENPAIVAAMLRTWLEGDENADGKT